MQRPRPALFGPLLIVISLLPTAACQPGNEAGSEPADQHGHDHGGDEGWAVTAWGEDFEIFAEADPLSVGTVSKSHTHVTILEDFSAMTAGAVTAVLRSPDGSELAFRQGEVLRAGIFDIGIVPAEPGDFDLFFRVETAAASEEIAAGTVRVKAAGEGGGLLDSPAQSGGGGEPTSFLKEQQWRTAFATEWVRSGEIAESVRGFGEVHPVAGGEIVLTAPVSAVVLPSQRWPYPGLALTAGDKVFQLASQIHDEHSLSELSADVRVLESDLRVARENRTRSEELLGAGVISTQRMEEERAEVTALEARLAAAESDLASARAARQGGATAEVVTVAAPWSGRVAEVGVTPGQAVTAGTPLGRMVKTDPLWVEVALRPAAAARLTNDPTGLHLRIAGLERPLSFTADETRLVSRHPEVDPTTGTVGVLLEVPGGRDEVRLGSAVEAEIALAEKRRGLVVPASALVDDGGVSVVYVQLDGESFARREVRVVARQGERVLVEGLTEGERLVTRGGTAIRRATLMTGAEDHGHVH